MLKKRPILGKPFLGPLLSYTNLQPTGYFRAGLATNNIFNGPCTDQ